MVSLSGIARRSSPSKRASISGFRVIWKVAMPSAWAVVSVPAAIMRHPSAIMSRLGGVT